MKVNKGRALAFETLLKWEKNRSYLAIEINNLLKSSTLSSLDKKLCTILIYGCVERGITIDFILRLLSSRDVDSISLKVKVALKMGLYQIFYLDRVPDSAACDESVELIKLCEHKGSAGFVNGILRNAVRKKEEIINKINSLDGIDGLCVRYSYQKWMVKLFIDSYGIDRAKAIMEEQNKVPSLTLRCNSLKCKPEDLEGDLSISRIEGDAIIVDGSFNVEDDGGFKKGLYFVQDLSSQRAVEALAPRRGELLIDVCSCPGGKSFSSAIEMENEGEIVALDLHANKLSLVNKGAQRLGIDIISTAARDAREPFVNYIDAADCVICDVPCSGLGVISKKPEIRYKSFDDIVKLPKLQYEILTSSAKYLKAGGRLLYSTCTLNPDENENIVDKFLKENGNFVRVGQAQTIMPSSECDGFYIDILKRIS